MTVRRWLRFAAVGLAGTGVQLAALALLIRALRAHYMIATILAVETAVLHNFLWHRLWTWKDRPGRLGTGLWRFHLTAAAVAVVPNAVLVRLLVEQAALDPLAANVAAIACCSAANFLLADRWVFSSGLR